jgi:hypothetical protein
VLCGSGMLVSLAGACHVLGVAVLGCRACRRCCVWLCGGMQLLYVEPVPVRSPRISGSGALAAAACSYRQLPCHMRWLLLQPGTQHVLAAVCSKRQWWALQPQSKQVHRCCLEQDAAAVLLFSLRADCADRQLRRAVLPQCC